MKNILLIGNYPPPYGGVPHHLELLSKYLVANGYKVYVVSGGQKKPKKVLNVEVIKLKIFDKFKYFIFSFIIDLFTGNFDMLMLMNEPRHWVRHKIFYYCAEKVVRNNEIDIISSYNLLAYSPIGARIQKKYNIPHIVNIFGEIYKNSNLSEKLLKRSKSILLSANDIISCSEHCGKSVNKIIPDIKYKVVTYGIDNLHFDRYQHVKNKVDPKIDKIEILFLGRQSIEMGLDKFLKVTRNILKTYVNKVNITVCGQKGDLTSAALKLQQKYPNNINIITNASYADLPNIYRSSNLTVVCPTGDRTCSSLSAMESVSIGVPVLVVKCGGIHEIISEEHGFIVDNTIDAISSELIRLINNPEEIFIKQLKLYKKSQYFSYKLTSNKVVKIFKSSARIKNF